MENLWKTYGNSMEHEKQMEKTLKTLRKTNLEQMESSKSYGETLGLIYCNGIDGYDSIICVRVCV